MLTDKQIASLRSRLRHASDEFRNLVADDLVGMKWKTFLLLVLGLFPLVPSLREAFHELGEMLERRSKEVTLERTAGSDRKDRIASEQAHRRAVHECVLRGLEALRWPPAMQAFSNPLQDLIDDPFVKLNAIDYLLSSIPGSDSEGRRIHEERARQRADPMAADHPPTIIAPPNVIEGKANYPRISSSQRSKRTIRSFASEDELPASIGAMKVSVERSSESAHPGDGLRGSFQTNETINSAPDFDSISRVSSARSAAADFLPSGGEDFTALRRSIQVLQFQNLELTKQLRNALASMRARDELENQMDTIIHDLRSSLSELSSIGGKLGEGNAQRSGRTDGSDTSSISASIEDAVGRGPRVSRSSSISTGHGATADRAGDDQKDSRQMWRFVFSQVDSLYRRWTEARGAVRDCMLAEVNLHPDSVRNFTKDAGTATRKSPVAENRSVSRSRAPPASSRSTRSQQEFTTDFSLDSVSLSSIGGPAETRNHTRQFSSHGGGSKSTSSHRTTASQLRVYQLLGLSPPGRCSDPYQRSFNNDKDSHFSAIELDAHRVAQLQRDLVDFSRSAFLIVNAIDSSDLASDPDLAPQAQKSKGKTSRSDTREQLRSLRVVSERLLLHTSSYAPLAPLDVPFPMSDDVTGLEALVAELQLQSKAARASPPEVIERIIERAQAEQEALVRALGYSEVHARSDAARQKIFSEKVRTISSSLRRIFEEQSRDLKRLQGEVIRPLAGSIASAEHARLHLDGLSISIPGSNSSGKKRTSSAPQTAAVNPLDALARGYMGGEVAALVNSLRVFEPGIQQLEKSLEKLSLLLGSQIPSELANIID